MVGVQYPYDSDFYDALCELVVDPEELKTGSAAKKQIVIRKAKPGERTGQLEMEE